MDETVKIQGRLQHGERGQAQYVEIDLPLRDLFAAFALAGMNAESAAVSEAAIYERAKRAFKFADAVLSTREGKRE